MTYSGTVSQTAFTTQKVLDSAFRRCRLKAEQITSEYISIANDQLYLLLSELANDGAPLWCIQKCIFPLYSGVADIITYSGTVDILNANLRTVNVLTGTTTVTATDYTINFSSMTTVSTVGMKWSAASTSLVLQTSSNGVAWTTVQNLAPVAVSGEWTWFDLDTIQTTQYMRIEAVTGTISFSQVVFANTPTEIPLGRMNRDQYTNLPNKTFTNNRPLQYWLDRQSLSPVMNLWPVPNSAAEVSQVVAWVHRHIMDVGAMAQQIEVPQRWLNAIISILAQRIAREVPEVDPGVVPVLDSDAALALSRAQTEERDNSPIMWQPNISPYTR